MALIRITFEFDSFDDAQRVLANAAINRVVAPQMPAPQPEQPQQTSPQGGEKVRKPRSDAGQPRGPNARTAAPTETATPPKKEPVAAGEKAPTIDEARAAMKRINDTKGLGMDGCMSHLKEFGVQKISDLKPEMYSVFIKQADEKIAEVLKA